MKKKTLSLMLILLFIPGIFMFAGCKDKGYQLVDLAKDYKNIQNSCKNVEIVDNRVVFKYDSYESGSVKYLTKSIEEIDPYTSLKNYNILLDNSLGFVYEYIEVCSSANIEADAGFRNNLKSQLDDLTNAICEVDIYIDQWARAMEVYYSDEQQVINNQCLSRFKTLLMGYNDLYQKSIAFSNSLANLYYGYALNDANPKVDDVKLADFDSTVVVGKLPGRAKYEISSLSQLFVEMYVDGTNLATYLTTPTIINEGEDDETVVFNSFSLNRANFEYLTMVNNLNRIFADSFKAEEAIERANSASNKQNFYNFAINAYNLQNILENDNKLFVEACQKIEYIDVDNSDSAEVQSKEIVDNYKYIVTKYYNVLNGMLNIIIR